LIDDQNGVVTLVPKDDLYEKRLSNLEEAKARGGQIIAIGTGANSRLEQISQTYLSLPEAEWFTCRFGSCSRPAFAYHVAQS